MIAPPRASDTAEEQRKKRFCVNYGQNAAGKWARKKAWRECDYNDAGHLQEFATKGDFVEFEEKRRAQGHCQARYEKKPRDKVPKEQLALEEAIANAVAADGNETRVQLQVVEEGLHERLDKQEADLREIRAHQQQQDKEQSADKRKAHNEAFALAPDIAKATPEQLQAQIDALQKKKSRKQS